MDQIMGRELVLPALEEVVVEDQDPKERHGAALCLESKVKIALPVLDSQVGEAVPVRFEYTLLF